MIWSRRTLFQRLVIAMSAVAVVEIGLSASFLYVRFQSVDRKLREETLSIFADDFASDIRADPSMQDAAVANLTLRIRALHGEFAVIAADGQVLLSSLAGKRPLVPAVSGRHRFYFLPPTDGGKALFGMSMPVALGQATDILQIAFPPQHIVFDTILEEFIGDIAWLWIPFILLLLLVNTVVLALTLRPLRLAAEEAASIRPSSMTTRLTEGQMPNDVLALVRAVNGALDRLQAGFLAMERFAAHLAHELRTPLAVAKARISRLPDAAARDVEADFNGMERVITQLIDHVRVGTIHFEAGDRVDLGALSATLARFMAPMLVQAGRRLELDCPPGPVVVAGAQDFLFRALRNLVENAIRHSPPGGLVSIRVFRTGIAVEDEGEGYSDARLHGTDEPDDATGDRSEGLGLGLAIVSETMVAHGGRLVLANRAQGGARAAMTFPEPPFAGPDLSESR
ncbi:hypothetical protein CSC94_20125 [Zhengella mangrovi]|uniref:histidine kinase n=1 Tax=Zhengella mangrovi TaxID=1982044 RepID=A0A2G1QIE0_9HYPH|nr:ATP-binding protein [Zhengella mangrovi]PHP65221.1 hypothetical protein CSC94_20125 [Zhengella mangrovi]